MNALVFPIGKIMTAPIPQPQKTTPPLRERIPQTVQTYIDSLETKKALPVKVSIFNRIYAWMNNKKSLTGVLLMVAGGALCVGPGTQIVGYKMLGEGVFALGTTLLGGGLINKAQKVNDPTAGQVIKTDWLSAIITILKKILEFLTKVK